MLTMSIRTAMWRNLTSLLLLAALLPLAGCAGEAFETRPWPDGPPGGQVLATEHYDLHTSIADAGLNAHLADTLERTRGLYAKIATAPGVESASGTVPERLTAYVFGFREQWADHTRETTGPAAAIYLQIGRGGYAHGDTFATFYHGGPQTLAVCRHEGWHQYVATTFERRPPPFLEEGVATLFEAGFQEGDLGQPRMSYTRLNRLREAVRRQRAWPLEKLLTMHAGNVVGTNGRQIETFYAQAWALARFLVESDRHRPGLRRLLAGYANGTATGNPRQMLETYLGLPFSDLEAQYEAYVRDLTRTPGR